MVRRPEQVVCTIVANNYLAYARVLAESVHKRHPDVRVVALIVDEPHPDLDYRREPFDVVFADALGVGGMRNIAFRYSVLELSTALKPSFLLYIRDQYRAASVVYFDPDILVTGDLDDLFRRVTAADLVLTPHITRPVDDECKPGERDYLQCGIYNLGFLGVSFNERTTAFLRWWERRLQHECLHAVDRGLFVDQKWMDFAPAFLSNVDIVRVPGYNVAYWNVMHYGKFSVNGDCVAADDVPIRFFHFSGLDIDRPDDVSKHQDRLSFRAREDLIPLFQRYRAALKAAGHQHVRRFRYRFGMFADGTPIPPIARRLLQVSDPDAIRWPDPFSITTPHSFFDWLSWTESGRDLPLPRIAFKVWDAREDLQRAFPDPSQLDRVPFAAWLVDHHHEHELNGFLDPIDAALKRMAATQSDLDAMQERVWNGLAQSRAPAPASLRPHEIDFLTAAVEPRPEQSIVLPRLAMMIHKIRADVQSIYPQPADADRAAYAVWYVTHGWTEYKIASVFCRPALESLPKSTRLSANLWRARHAPDRLRHRHRTVPRPVTSDTPEPLERTRPTTWSIGPPGVNVIGWASAPTGIGEACRATLETLRRANVPHVLWDLERDGVAGPHRGREGDPRWAGQPFEITLLHANADAIEDVVRHLPTSLRFGRYHVGYWFWELAHFPARFAPACRLVDEIWAPSEFCRQAYRSLATVEVRWVPPAVRFFQPTLVPAARSDAPSDAFVFFNAFDARSIPERKYPFGLLRAFGRAHRRSRRRLHLVLKVIHMEDTPELGEQLHTLALGLPVTIVSRTVSREEMTRLMANSDAYVSLHRSEGLGLPLIEAMHLGKPVIATGYGGVTDFLDDETGWQVPYKLVSLSRAHGPYPEGAVWADPDIDAAADLMCEVAGGSKWHDGRIAAARARVIDLYDSKAAAERFGREIERVHARIIQHSH